MKLSKNEVNLFFIEILETYSIYDLIDLLEYDSVPEFEKIVRNTISAETSLEEKINLIADEWGYRKTIERQKQLRKER